MPLHENPIHTPVRGGGGRGQGGGGRGWSRDLQTYLAWWPSDQPPMSTGVFRIYCVLRMFEWVVSI